MKKFILKKIIIIFLIALIFNSFLFAETNTKERINVAFCIDNNYPLYTMLLINSILLNNESKSEYMFYVVNNNLSLWNKIRMKLYVTLRGQNIGFIKVDTGDIDGGKNLFDSNEITKHVSRIGTARILLPELLPKEIDKVLYLDSDMLVVSDLKELYDIPLDNYYAGMVIDFSYFVYNGNIKNQELYCNSGMILMNLPLWREKDLSNKIIQYINNNKNLRYVDQDSINAIIKKNIKVLSYKYNNQVAIDSLEYKKATGIKKLDINQSCIIHYITSSKPWNKYRENKLFNIYYSYWGKSGLLFERMFFVFKSYYDRSLFKKLILIISISANFYKF